MKATRQLAAPTKRTKIVPLVEVVEFNPRFGKDELADDSLASFIPMKCVEEESGRFESLGDRKVAEVRKGYTPFRDGDVIFAKVTPCMENGKAAVLKGLTNGVGFGSTEFFALRPKNGLEANYLFHFILQSNFRRDAARNMTGAVGLRRVPKPWLEQQQIPLPEPDEQRKIVAEIEKQFTRLEAGVAALRRVQANLKRYRAAVLKAACEGRLVLTEKWPMKTVRDVTSIVTKGSSPNWQGFEYCDDGVVFVRSQNVGWGKLDLSDVAHLPAGFNDKEKKSVLKVGDVLLNIVGASIGRAAIATSDVAGGNVNQAVAVIRCQQEKILPQFLMIYLLSPATQTLIHSQAVDVARANFSLGDISKMPVPIPSLAEQTRIVAEVERRLSVVEELESVVSANLQRTTRLRQSILHKAFAGELVATVPAVQISDIIPPLKPEHIHQPNSHFARALLSAEIVHRLHIEPTFGRIKHQKIFHLCEHIAQIEEIHGQYHREAAGPLDNKLIYANEAELKKQKWYQEVRRESYGHAYQALDKAGGHRKYVERYWADKLPTIEKLIELMRKWDTERCEIFCTAYAAWNDLVLWGKQATEDNILHEILERWHDSKKRFPKERWLKAIAWMKKEGFVPTGFGKPTKEAK